MPSRTRIVLRNLKAREGDICFHTNESAKRLLSSLVLEAVLWKTGLPEGWPKLKLRGKLKYLSTLLPPEWVLEVYTEPRATRPTRSVYKSQFVREAPLHPTTVDELLIADRYRETLTNGRP